MDWIDNAGSYICPVCRYETNNPLDNNACCPKCGFIPDRFQTPAKPEYIERQKTIDVIRRRCAPCAVRDYMVSECLGGFDCKKGTTGGYEWTLKDGRIVELRVTIKETEDD